jgi:ferrous-iron efflux pump FieF
MKIKPPEEIARLMRMATYASSGVALTLIATKLVAWMMTNSVSMLATLIDSCLDALASIINLVAVRHALTPADKQHRFGHGKAEALAGLGQATFIAGSAMFLILEATSRIWHPQAISDMLVGVGVMAISIIATVGLLIYQNYVIRQTGSTAIRADHMHYKTDLAVNIGVIATLILASYGWPGLDPVFAAAISVYILRSAWGIARESLDLLMDHELPNSDRDKIKAIALAHPETRGLHDLRTRRSGTTAFIQLHLELGGSLTLLEAHGIADEVEARLLEAFPGAEIIIHEDPDNLVEARREFVP